MLPFRHVTLRGEQAGPAEVPGKPLFLPTLRGRTAGLDACRQAWRADCSVWPQEFSRGQVMPQIVEFNQIQDAWGYAAAWTRLLGQTPGASFFQTLEWLEIYWRHFGHDQKLRLLLVMEGEQVLGIVPLVVRRENKRIASLRVLTYPLHDWGSFYGPIGRDPVSLLRLALQHVRSTPRDWDMIDLRWAGSLRESDGSDPTAEAIRRQGLIARRRVWKRVAVIDTLGRWEDYLGSRRSSLRSSIRRYERRLGQLGEVTLDRYRPAGSAAGDDDPQWEEFRACLQIARHSWQGRASDGTTLSHRSVQGFLQDVHRAAVRLGAADMNLLRLNGKPIAFAYNYVWRGTVYGLRTGYEPEYARHGAGKVLWARTFADSFRRGDCHYDIGPDSLKVKQPWLTRMVPVYSYAHHPSLSLRSQLFRVARWARDCRGSGPAAA
ncbi:MAG: GNAT family N-acetyltransferase [Planctomycetales bacterium]|nr:GNAT family N-acetyltransferase [Planctomycetales bacterium]NIM09590.1 GNAT family N-acetyltransferase [Planctomycetales bacterium]NIN09079.1 GNAT family N-acetyltransferase [Planctomycetales bacterium]NIN78189.1 GNAT family N-acetyltransferase [Planctomycetales bacterium]NIO47122.1 GNAT family N-acetyltransferase [Planctomycetales bacterium]